MTKSLFVLAVLATALILMATFGLARIIATATATNTSVIATARLLVDAKQTSPPFTRHGIIERLMLATALAILAIGAITAVFNRLLGINPLTVGNISGAPPSFRHQTHHRHSASLQTHRRRRGGIGLTHGTHKVRAPLTC
jgi:hypothetical protein